MPLGDSITLGCCSGTSVEGGYRTRLYSVLTAEGFNVDFVGTQKDDNNPALPDVDHEGHGGFHIADARGGLPVWLKEDNDPDVILLHIGTNDFSTGHSVSATQDALRGLLADLTTARPHAKIIVSSLILRTDNATIKAQQETYNQSLPGIVSEQVALGRQVSFLDMSTVLEPDDLNEGIHPKIAGYDKIADAWLPAINSVITPLGTSNPLAISRVDARQDLNHVTVTFSKPVEDAAATVSNFTLSGGIGITAAELDATSKRTVTLTTTTQAVGTLYNLTASGVRDRMPVQNMIAPGASLHFTSRTLLDGSFEANGTGWAKGGSSQVYDALPSTPATDGSKLMIFNGVNTPTGGEVSQTVVTIPGQKYELGFDVGVFSSGSQALQVSVSGNNSTVLSQTENISGNSPDSTLWENRSYEFTANSLSTTVTFQDVSASTLNADLLLDDVRLNLGVTQTLTVNSTPATGVSVSVSPNDNSALGNGTTTFTRTYDQNVSVNLTAPATSGGKFFDRWKKDAANHSTSAATSVSMNADHTMTADYRILKNGSFEFGSPADFGTLTNWTTSGNLFTYTSDGNYFPSDFTRMVVFNGGNSAPDGTISQTFATTPSQAYQVDFDLGLYAANTNPQEINVAITGISSPVSQNESLARGFSDPSLKWASRTATFVASGSTATITFTDITAVGNGNGADLLLDNVKVSETFANTAPVAVNDSYSTSINVPLNVAAASGVLANDTDAQNNTLTALVVANPTHGSLTLNTNGGFTYTPTTGYTGPDSFTYKANDGSLDSNVAAVSLTITSVASGTLVNGSFEQGSPANLGPATGWNMSANYPTAGAPLCYVPDGGYPATVPDGVRLLIFNAGGDVFSGAVSQQFSTTPGQLYSLNLNTGVFSSGSAGKVQKLQVTVNGTATLLSQVETLTSTGGTAALAPKSYSFTADSATTTLILSDASSSVAPSSLASGADLLVDYVRVALASANTAPVAVNDSYSTNQNTALNISAPGVLANDTDAQSNPLTAIQISGPSNGTLSLASNGSFTYTPTSGYTGPDAFTYKANDGSLDSTTATASITVNTPAVELLANGSFESGAIIVNSGSPGNAGSVTALDNWGGSGARFGFIQIPEYPATDGQRMLVFNGGYNGGSDTFDGSVTQSFATTPGQSYSISMDVGIYAAGNANKNQRLQVQLEGTGNLLNQPVVRASTNATTIVQWAPANFTFIANSATTTLTLSDSGSGFASSGSDLVVDHVQVNTVQNARTLTVNSSPASGFAVTVSPADLGGSGDGTTNFTRTYANNTAVTLTAAASSGANSFLKWQKNGVDLTNSVTANITMDANYTLNAVYVVNNAPFATADSYTTNEDVQKVVAAPGVLANDSDPNSVPITAVLDAGPSNGTLTLNPNGSFTYDPTPNYNGPDSFTYHAFNGTLSSPVVTVSLTVTSVNDVPVAVGQSVQTNEDVPLPITLVATDPDGGPLTYTIVAGPLNGGLSGTGANRTYTPAANYNGTDSFTFKANDGVVDSNTVTVSINILPVEDIPVANSQSLTMTGATTLPITLTGNDPEGSPITYTLVSSTTQGILTGTAPNLVYKPLETYVGSDSFTFKVNDGLADSLVATVSITVNSILVNGSFESVSGTSPNFTPNNWVVTSSNASAATYEINTTPTPQDGVRLAAFNTGNRTPNAIFTQTFATTPGRSYTLVFELGIQTFDIASRTQSMGVNLSGITSTAPVTQTITRTGTGGGLVFWETKTIDFTPGTASTTLQLRDLSVAGASSAVDMLLDKVRIIPKNTRILTIASSPDPGVNVTVSPADLNSSAGGVTGFSRTYLDAQVVNISVPAAIGAQNFQKWQRNGIDFAVTAATSVTMSANYTLTAFYIPNAVPVVTADSYTTSEDVALVVPSLTGVLSNDTDPESVAMTAVLDVGPTNGTLTLNPNGGFTYTPNPNYFGPDSFTYRASDGVSNSAITTVSLTVNSVNDAPVGLADSYSTNEDTPLVVSAPGVLGNDSDVEGNALTAVLNVAPTNGSLTLASGGGFTYTPAANYNGADSFTYRANDGNANSAINTVSLTVNSINDVPVAVAQSVNVNEDGSVAITLSGTDADGNSLTYTVGTAANGSLSGTAPNLTYTPAENYNGSDSFTFTVNDGLVTSAPALVSITVAAVNDVPVAAAQSVNVNEDGSVAITLTATDVEGSQLTFTAGTPAQGSLSGTAPNLTYTPAANYNGPDSFTFKVNDGTVDSPSATVSITVAPINDTPVAVAQSVNVNEDGSVAITLTGTDVDGDILTYTVGTAANGSLSGTAPNLTYTPAANYNGSDSFTFTVKDALVTSAPALVSITVAPINDAPVAVAQSVNVNEDGSVAITLTATDVEGSPLTFTAGTPAQGSLSGTAPNLTYTPAANYNGPDSFTFKVNDITVDSPSATVSITVAPINDTPVAVAQSVSVNEDGTVAITLIGTDVDGDPLNFTAGAAAHGTLTGTAPNLTYSSAANYNGSDSFTFTVNDGTVNSSPATVSITIAPINDAPVATAQLVNVDEDGSVAITLSGTDVEGNSLTYSAGTPAQGTLSGTAPNLTYTPSANYNGSDSFTFTVNDGTVDSTPATVSVTVAPINDAPVAAAQSVNVNEDGTVAITLTGTDVDGNLLNFTAGTPAQGSLTGTAPNLTYTPAANYNGPDSFTFTVNDGTVDSTPATVSITIAPINDAPVATAQLVNVDEDGSVAITLSGTDVEGNSLTYSAGTPAQGSLTGTAPNVTYTPAANYNGSDSFTFTVSDGTVNSSPATVSITVAPINDAPVAAAQSVNVNEDGTVAITLTGTDVDGDPLNFTAGAASHGMLTGTAPNLTYSSAANYNGSDSFTFTVNDGTVNSSSATVSITIAPINDAPVATAQLVNVDEEGSVAITLSGTDVEGNSLTYSAGTPAQGSLTGTAPNLTYTPSANYNGSDSFTFTVNDGTVDSTPATVSITIAPINDAPVAAAQSVNVNEDGTVAISLTGTDVDGNLLTFTAGTPAQGSLTGTAPNVTYTPAANYNGSDSFTFTVNDGTVDSTPATVSITVAPINDAPVAAAQSVNVNEDGTVAITLSGTDVEGNSLTYSAGTPAQGSLTGTAPNVTYTPAANYNGSDSFTFTVNDGTVDSSPATVSITVAPINDAPVANAQSVSLDEDTTAAITLSGSDLEGSALTFSVTVQPQNGTLSGSGPNLTYTPAPNYNGTDSFSFVANDGMVNSAPAEVSITIAPVPDNSFGEWLASYGLGGGPGNDPDHDSISNAVEYVIGGNPANRADQNLLPTISLVTADPDQNSVSNDYLLYTYRRTDLSKTDPNTIIQVQWSTALAGGWANAAGTPGVVTIEENDAAASGVDLVKVYIPRSLAANGKLFARLYVSIDYTSLNVAPVTANQSVLLNEDGSLLITLAATDANGDPMSVTVTGNPQHGTLSSPVPGLGGSSPSLTYTPAPNYNGPDSFTYKVNDGTVDSAPATVSITVNPQEEFAQWMNTFSLNASPTVDSDNDSISNVVEYVIGGNPAGRADVNLLPIVSLATADPDGNTVNSDYLLFTYRRTDVASTDPSMTIRVTWGTSLAGTWTNATGTPGVVTLVTDNGAGPSTDIVSVYIPRSLAVSGKLFARLQASLATP